MLHCYCISTVFYVSNRLSYINSCCAFVVIRKKDLHFFLCNIESIVVMDGTES